MREKIAVLFSGGKDSTLAAFYTLSMGFDPILVVFSPKLEDSYMLHKPCLSLTPLQAEAMDLALFSFDVSGEKEKEVDEMLNHLKKLDIDGISTGAIESEYQKQRIDYIGEELGIPTYSFLWHRNREVMDDFKEMEIILIKASGYGISASDVGKPFRIYHPYIHPFLEGGEGETAVLDAPFFKKKVTIEKSGIRLGKDTAELLIKKASLAKKGVQHGKKGI
jgi:predicted ATP pyrophosphatase (TIGR00289 family)